jgi:hypothetical protein
MASSLQTEPTSPTSRHAPPSSTVAGGAQHVEYNDARSPPPSHSEATTPFEDAHFLPRSPPPDTQRSSSRMFPSPLNSTPPVTNPFTRSSSTSSRPVSRSSSTHPFVFSKFRDEGRSPGSHFSPSTMAGLGLGVASSGLPSTLGPRGGSMVLYRLADDPSTQRGSLVPPRFSSRRNSMVSSSGDSMVSFQSDSKYPNEISTIRGLVPYAYDPTLDEMGPLDAEDYLHDPKSKGGFKGDKGEFPWRGILNVAVLLLLVLGLLILFIFYPVLTFYRNAARNNAIDGNIRINATGASSLLHFSSLTRLQANHRYCFKCRRLSTQIPLPLHEHTRAPTEANTNLCSRMSSPSTAGRSTLASLTTFSFFFDSLVSQAMIHSGKPSISGTVPRETLNGTIHSRLRHATAHW